MSSTQPTPIGAFADHIYHTLKPRRVLDAGDRLGPLGTALLSAGVEVSPATLTQPVSERYDLVICHGFLDRLPLDRAVAAIRNAARATDAILYLPGPDDAAQGTAAVWLRLFYDAGFAPDVLHEWGSLEPAPVLLRRSRVVTNETASAAPEYQELEDRISELRMEIADLREMQDASAERFDGRITQLQSKMNRVAHDVQNILNSRIWQTLVAAGGLVLRIAGMRRGVRRGPAGREAFLQVICDEPKISDKAVSGIVTFRGWAGATSGIARVEIQPQGQDAIAARCGLYRPDIAKQFPELPDGDRTGYQANLDTSALSNGAHSIAVRAISKSGSETAIEIPLIVDHVGGYASDYYRWIAEFEKRDAKLIEMRLQSFPRKPLISILVPVYRTAPNILEKTIQSVLAQSYSNWELCLADDCSQSPEIDAIFARYTAADRRIRTVRLPANGGISKASNAAFELARGEYIALLDHDDELAQDALYHVVNAINRHPEAEIFYSDEDHIDESGVRSDPFFKPDWSPDLILSENYVCHLLVFRADLGRETGGFRNECDLSQDHDILLRMSAKAKQIVHIPLILYHWRTDVFTIDRASHRTDRALATSRRAIEDYLEIAGVNASVEPGAVSGRWRLRYDLRPAGAGTVDIIIPCGGKVNLLERCMDSIAAKTDYPRYNITVVDNSRGVKVQQFVRDWSRGGRKATYVDWRDRPFNFSAMNNDAAKTCKAPLLLFLNDDITVINPDWLSAMVELASRPEVGAVGAKLLYPDGRIQHAGLIVGLFGVAGHAFKGMFSDQRIYFDFPDVIRNVSAVTGACMLVPSKLYWEVGGFDEEHFPVAYNDVDLCLKILEKGKRVLYTPHAQLYHYEAFSKRSEDKDPRPAETRAFQTKWKQYIESDPFYNPNLTRTDEDYSPRRKSVELER